MYCLSLRNGSSGAWSFWDITVCAVNVLTVELVYLEHQGLGLSWACPILHDSTLYLVVVGEVHPGGNARYQGNVIHYKSENGKIKIISIA